MIVRQTRRLGVKRSFVLGALIGALGSGCIALAVERGSYAGICLAAAVLGYGNAHGNLYRFWAARFEPRHQVPTAIAAVLTGGCVGAAVGPEYSKRTAALFPRHRYSGIFAITAAVFAANAAIIALVRFPAEAAEGADDQGNAAPAAASTAAATAGAELGRPSAGEGRSAAAVEDSAAGGTRDGSAAADCELAGTLPAERDPKLGSAERQESAPGAATVRGALGRQECWTAIVVASLSYGIMAFLMVPVPVSMVANGYSFTASSLVVQVHMLAMFVPSFLSGRCVAGGAPPARLRRGRWPRFRP